MADAWVPPRRLPVLLDVPADPPSPRIAWDRATSPARLGVAVVRSGGRLALGGGVLLVAFNVAATLVPVALGAAVDRGIGPVTAGAPATAALGGFLGWTAVVAGLYVVLNLTYRFGGRMGWFCVQRAQHELSARVVGRVLDARGLAGPAQLPGRLLSVATSDCMRTASALYFAIYPVGNLVAVVVAAVTLFWIHPLLGAMVTLGAPGLLAVMALAARPLHARAGREQEGVADASAAAGDLVRGYRVLAGIHAQRTGAAQYRATSRGALRGSLAATSAESTLIGVNSILTGLFAGAVALTAAGLALGGSITVGQLVAAAGTAQVVLTPLRVLVEEAATVSAVVLASARRVLDLLEAPPHPAAVGEATLPRPLVLTIEADGLDEPLLLEAGELVAVDLAAAEAVAWVGALGLTADRDPPCGPRVTLAGRPLHEHAATDVRRAVLLEPHDADLLEDTVLGNVLADVDPDLLDDDPEGVARRALEVAGCAELDHQLPDGLTSRVAETGRTLSGGQRQRVALARAVAVRPPVLVLHEPTSAVDAVTERDVAERLHRARRGLTTLVLTSSPAFHAVADRSLRTRPGSG